jgi:hypothetical protein
LQNAGVPPDTRWKDLGTKVRLYWWKYVTATKGDVMVKALDLAGNSTKQKMHREMPGSMPWHITKDRRRL